MKLQRIEPQPGQECVWDYPRPPAVSPTSSHVVVIHGGQMIAETRSAVRVLETSQPPAFYIPAVDVLPGRLRKSTQRSMCEWKGLATYWDVTAGDVVVSDAAWSYEQPTPAFASITGHVAFYAQLIDECWVDEERVDANPGSFYGGWITSRVVGPFKGGPGTMGW